MSYPVKRYGHCTRCGDAVIGTDTATQVEFLLSDGTVTHVTFCLPCAHALAPDEYAEVWAACVRASGSGRPPDAHLADLWIVGQQLRRREDPDHPGALVLDTR